MGRKKETPPMDANPSSMNAEEYAAWRAAQLEPTGFAPPAEGNGTSAPPEVVAQTAAVNGRAARTGPKAPRSTFYLIIGETRDGSAMDVLGKYGTRHQAAKAKEAMGMAIARSYGDVLILQCRDKTAE